jgi:MFS family permease
LARHDRNNSPLPPSALVVERPNVGAADTSRDDPFAELPPEVARVYPRNFAANVLYHIFMRMGWIFKTESTIIPGFVTELTRHPLLIGMTPFLSRLLQFLPQFLFLGAVEHAPRKKPLMLTVAVLFSASWGVLAAILWLGGGLPGGVLLALFFLLYGGSWTCVGVQHVLDRVMLGRLIPTRRRGRILAVAGPMGSYSVFLSGPIIAYLLSQGGFPRNYAIVFGLGFATFLVAVAGLTLLKEPPEARRQVERTGLRKLAQEGWALVRDDGDFRRVFGLACVQTLSVYLFSYYIAYARTWSAGSDFQRSVNGTLGWALAVQNLVIGTLSMFMGLLVDWKGNRVVLRTLYGVTTIVPVAMVFLGQAVPLSQRLSAFVGVYALVGCLPVLNRVQTNYLLEIAPPERQALYIGIFGSGQIVTVPLPFLLGGLIAAVRRWLPESAAYEITFLLCGGVLAAGSILAWRLREPRDKPGKGPAVAMPVAERRPG